MFTEDILQQGINWFTTRSISSWNRGRFLQHFHKQTSLSEKKIEELYRESLTRLRRREGIPKNTERAARSYLAEENSRTEREREKRRAAPQFNINLSGDARAQHIGNHIGHNIGHQVQYPSSSERTSAATPSFSLFDAIPSDDSDLPTTQILSSSSSSSESAPPPRCKAEPASTTPTPARSRVSNENQPLPPDVRINASTTQAVSSANEPHQASNATTGFSATGTSDSTFPLETERTTATSLNVLSNQAAASFTQESPSETSLISLETLRDLKERIRALETRNEEVEQACEKIVKETTIRYLKSALPNFIKAAQDTLYETETTVKDSTSPESVSETWIRPHDLASPISPEASEVESSFAFSMENQPRNVCRQRGIPAPPPNFLSELNTFYVTGLTSLSDYTLWLLTIERLWMTAQTHRLAATDLAHRLWEPILRTLWLMDNDLLLDTVSGLFLFPTNRGNLKLGALKLGFGLPLDHVLRGILTEHLSSGCIPPDALDSIQVFGFEFTGFSCSVLRLRATSHGDTLIRENWDLSGDQKTPADHAQFWTLLVQYREYARTMGKRLAGVSV